MTAVAAETGARSTDPPVVDRTTQNVVFATVVLGMLLAVGGRPDSAQLGAALSDISRKLLQHHDEHHVPPSLAPAA
jgi:hypothetical protein